jgi:hypothetical protein
MTTAEQIKQLRAEYVRIGYIVRDMMEMPVPRNRNAARAQRIQIIREYQQQQDAIYAQMVELQKAGA